MANRLAGETSPYLLQHKDNPVDWFPWGPEALAMAKQLDKPILVSIGYSACHWCHVMAHESFEDPAVAAKMNEWFVNIKVDREERPDIDGLFMIAVQALTGQGGWPLNVFLTPDGVPFYGGTYFPPAERQGMPSWLDVLEAVANTWADRRDDVNENASQVQEFLRRANSDLPAAEPLRAEMFDTILGELHRAFDDRNGGFGQAPKFPQAAVLDAVLRIYQRSSDPRAANIARTTLDKMAAGGIYDQIGGGFHRYAVDAIWLVPHFEKMLFDNAQLALTYLNAWRILGDDRYKLVAEQTLDYLARDMRGAEGQFFAAEDADSEGEEGKFYVWSAEELRAVLGEENASLIETWYGVTERGNFEGANILHRPLTIAQLATRAGVTEAAAEAAIVVANAKLLTAREARPRPGRDEKAIAAWNALAVKAFAEAGAALNRPDSTAIAEQTMTFILEQMVVDGKLYRSWKDGRAAVGAFLEDYATIVDALLVLHATTLKQRWLEDAIVFADAMVAEFRDPERAGFFDTASSAEPLVARPRDLQDGATPAGNSVAIDVLFRLAAMTGDEEWSAIGAELLATLARRMTEQPLAFGRFIQALDFYLSSPIEVALAGDQEDPELWAMVHELFATVRPNVVIGYAGVGESELTERVPFLADRPAREGKATAYVCEQFACLAPVTSVSGLLEQLERDKGLAWQEI